MSIKEDYPVKVEYEENNLYYPDYKNDDEQSDNSQLNDSQGVLTHIRTPKGETISVYLRLGNKLLFCSGKFFHIEHATAYTEHQKEYTGIVSTCLTCGVKIKGSLKVSSNFICHLKARHPEVYQEFLKQKEESGPGTRIRKTEKFNGCNRSSPYPTSKPIMATSPMGTPPMAITPLIGNVLQQPETQVQFQRHVLKFLIATNQSLSLVENANFHKLFEFMGFPMQFKSPEYYAQIIKDDCKYKQLELANFFNQNNVYVCLSSDTWSYGECKYLALAAHWIDEHYQRKTSLLACIRTDIHNNTTSLQTLQNNVWLSYGFKRDFIVNKVIENIQNYSLDFKEFGITQDILCINSWQLTEDGTLLKHIKENLKLLQLNSENDINVQQLDVLKLNKMWTIGFMQHLDEKTKQLHLNCMEKCCKIWQFSCTKLFKDNFETSLNGKLTPPNLFSLCSLYISLKQLLLNKTHLSAICSLLQKPNFDSNEILYLEELLDIFEPLHAAFEFLDMPQNHFYGCFLPTLVTLKWKLTRLYNSNKLHFLQNLLLKLKDQLLSEFKSYYELNDIKADAILAAITYPPVKTRFLKGLQDTVLQFNFQARNVLLKYGKDYHVIEESTENNLQQNNHQMGWDNVTAATDFFDFGDGTEKVNEDYQLPNSLIIEIDTYLADIDNSLISLQKYPTIKRMFYRFNTCIPSPASVLRLFPLNKLLRQSLFTTTTHELFENCIFFQSHFMDK